MLKLIFITNNVRMAKIAEIAGVDRIMIDLEILGKKERQMGRDTLISNHRIEDIYNIKNAIEKSELIVRINPINKNSPKEIEDVVKAGADIIMLPMFKTKSEVEMFLNMVNGRTKNMLLMEHADAVNNIDEILQVPDINEMHIGLNDLHISMGNTFMFELIADGTVEYIVKKSHDKNIPVGIGGMSRLGTGIMPAELILAEHCRLHSNGVILSRGFLDNIDDIDNIDIKELQQIFCNNVMLIREKERQMEEETNKFFEDKHKLFVENIDRIVKRNKVKNK